MKTLIIILAVFAVVSVRSELCGEPSVLSKEQCIGTYICPTMLTWSHSYTLCADGSAEYHVEYDSLTELPDGSVQTGHSYEGSWKLLSDSTVSISFLRGEGRIVSVVLSLENIGGKTILTQLSPSSTLDGFTDIIFTKEAQQVDGD
jgi:hypothetical protein